MVDIKKSEHVGYVYAVYGLAMREVQSLSQHLHWLLSMVSPHGSDNTGFIDSTAPLTKESTAAFKDFVKLMYATDIVGPNFDRKLWSALNLRNWLARNHFTVIADQRQDSRCATFWER